MLLVENDPVIAYDSSYLWNPYTDMQAYATDPMIMVEGNGVYLTDHTGASYFDAISGLWNVQVGYGRTEIIDAITQQLGTLAYTPLNGRAHLPAIELASELARLAPGELRHSFFTTGGAESVETAIKMARQFWRQNGRPLRHKIIGLARGWHGCTLGALAASGVAEEQMLFEPLAGGFLKIPMPSCYHQATALCDDCSRRYAEALEGAILQEGADTIAAFLAEPMMGLAGMQPLSSTFWEIIQSTLRTYDILLIVDEVAMGFGRTGTMFACEQDSIRPDMLACAKGITSGYLPLGAVLTTPRIYESFLGRVRAFSHGYTFGGHPASCAAAVANLKILRDEGLVDHAKTVGADLLAFFQTQLRDVSIVGHVRGRGFAMGIEFVEDRSRMTPLPIAGDICRRLKEAGILIRPVGRGHVLPFMPPLITSYTEAMNAAEIICATIRSYAQELNS